MISRNEIYISDIYDCCVKYYYLVSGSPVAILFCAGCGVSQAQPSPTTTFVLYKTVVSGSYLYLSEKKILKMPSFQEISCNQQWQERELVSASAGLVSYNNTKELMVCGGYRMTGCYIWTEQGWIQSDTTFNR